MKGHCRTKGHTDNPHKQRSSCVNWAATAANEPIDYSAIQVEQDEQDTEKALDVTAEEGIVSEE